MILVTGKQIGSQFEDREHVTNALLFRSIYQKAVENLELLQHPYLKGLVVGSEYGTIHIMQPNWYPPVLNKSDF